MTDQNKSKSLAPQSSGAGTGEDTTEEGSQIENLPPTDRTDPEEEVTGYAIEEPYPEIEGPTSALSKEVKSVAQRSVRINPLGEYHPVPSTFDAWLSRTSTPRTPQYGTYDKREKEMVSEVIYKQGGYIWDAKKQNWIKVEPGTALPTSERRPVPTTIIPATVVPTATTNSGAQISTAPKASPLVQDEMTSPRSNKKAPSLAQPVTSQKESEGTKVIPPEKSVTPENAPTTFSKDAVKSSEVVSGQNVSSFPKPVSSHKEVEGKKLIRRQGSVPARLHKDAVKPASSTPNPASSTPNPASSTPNPASSTPNPASSTHKPSSSTKAKPASHTAKESAMKKVIKRQKSVTPANSPAHFD